LLEGPDIPISHLRPSASSNKVHRMIVLIAGNAVKATYVNPDHIVRLEEAAIGTIVHLSDGKSVTIDTTVASVVTQLTKATPSMRDLMTAVAKMK
jgi:hypothetical protein